MRLLSKATPAVREPVTDDEACQACGATTALETALIAPGQIAPCCKDPVACRLRADKVGNWKTYP